MERGDKERSSSIQNEHEKSGTAPFVFCCCCCFLFIFFRFIILFLFRKTRFWFPIRTSSVRKSLHAKIVYEYIYLYMNICVCISCISACGVDLCSICRLLYCTERTLFYTGNDVCASEQGITTKNYQQWYLPCRVIAWVWHGHGTIAPIYTNIYILMCILYMYYCRERLQEKRTIRRHTHTHKHITGLNRPAHVNIV